jgi:regulatory protein
MPKITSMQPHLRRPDEWHISLDGDYAFTLDGATLVAEGLAVGMELREEDITRLRAAAEERRIYDSALSFLTARPRSRAEVRRRLLRPRPNRQSPAPEVVDRVLARLERMNLLDDREFSDFWVEQRERFSPRAASAVRFELRQRGVAREVTEEAVDAEQDEERALAAGRQRLRSLGGLDYETFRDRLGPFLLRRGFSYTIARQVTKTLWEESHGDAPIEDVEDEIDGTLSEE